MDFSQFASGLVAGLLSSVIAGALVLYLGYRFVEQRLRLQDTSARQRERDFEREQNRASVLGAIHSELEGAAAYLQLMLEALPRGQIPYPGFDITDGHSSAKSSSSPPSGQRRLRR